MSDSRNHNEIPLLLRNLKRAFKQNIQGPVKNREREYQATTKPEFIFDLTKFLKNRGIEKLATINAWKSQRDIKIAYHFIAKIGAELLDTKITIITFLTLTAPKIDSIATIFPNAEMLEKEIAEELNIDFQLKK